LISKYMITQKLESYNIQISNFKMCTWFLRQQKNGQPKEKKMLYIINHMGNKCQTTISYYYTVVKMVVIKNI
jgi:hypothetical protein